MRNVADYVARAVPPRRPAVVVGVGHGQGDRRPAATSPARFRAPTRAGRWTCSSPPASARPWPCCAWRCTTWVSRADSFTGQSGRDRHRHRPHQGQDRRRAPATASARPWTAGRVPVVGGAQGVSIDREVTFLGRGGLGHDRGGTGQGPGCRGVRDCTPTSPGCSPPTRGWCPTARRLVKVSYEEMLEMYAAGCPKPAMRSVEFARNHGVRLHVRSSFHLGARHLDRGGRPRYGAGDRLGRGRGPVRGQGDGGRASRTGRASPPGCSGRWPTARSTST